MRSITRTIWTLMIGAVTLLSTPARAEEGESPRAMMNIDRSQPGFSSRTVERGHVQAELGASYRVNKSFASRGFPPPNQPPPTTSERLMGLVVRGRVGLPAQLELSLSAELFGWQRSITRRVVTPSIEGKARWGCDGTRWTVVAPSPRSA